MLKKLLLPYIAGFSLITSSVFAGGPEIPPPISYQPSIYVEANFGVDFTDWPETFQQIHPFDSTTWRDARGGFAWGLDIGYQFNPHLALEIGGYDFKKVHVYFTPLGDSPEFLETFRDWISYAAAKLILPVIYFDGLELFVKGGVAYRDGLFKEVDLLDGAVKRTSYSGIRPIFATGLQYHVTKHWLIKGEYAYIPDGNSRSQLFLIDGGTEFLSTPSSHIATGGIGYVFYT